MKKLIYLLLLASLFTSCLTPEQRLARLVKNNPQLAKDTTWRVVEVHDTTLVPVPGDTASLTALVFRDNIDTTIVGERAKVHLKTFSDLLFPEIKYITVDGICLPETLFVDKLVKVNVPQYIEIKVDSRKPFWKVLGSYGTTILWIALLLAVAFAVLWLRKRFF